MCTKITKVLNALQNAQLTELSAHFFSVYLKDGSSWGLQANSPLCLLGNPVLWSLDKGRNTLAVAFVVLFVLCMPVMPSYLELLLASAEPSHSKCAVIWEALINRILLQAEEAAKVHCGRAVCSAWRGTQDGAQRWACPGPPACGPEGRGCGSLPFWMGPWESCVMDSLGLHTLVLCIRPSWTLSLSLSLIFFFFFLVCLSDSVTRVDTHSFTHKLLFLPLSLPVITMWPV